MNEKTLVQIVSDFAFLIGDDELSTLNEIATSLNAYLFALAQHGVIDSTDYKIIGTALVKSAIETAERNANTEESSQKNGEEKC